MNLKNLTIGTQLILGFAAMFILVIGLGVISYFQGTQIHEQTATLYNHPLMVRRAIGELKSDILLMQRNKKDVFLEGSEERQAERAVIAEYRKDIEAMLSLLNANNRDAGAAFARVPEQIRGFGHVKARHLDAARQQWALLRDKVHQPQLARA